MHKYLALFLLPLSLIACNAEPEDADAELAELAAEQPRTEVYQCEDKSEIEVTYAGDTAVINTGEQQYLMTLAVSASGARYVSDEGLEWHVKGGEGIYGVNDDTQICSVIVDTPES